MPNIDYDKEIAELKQIILKNTSEEQLAEIEELLQLLEDKEPEFFYTTNIDQGSTCHPEMKFTVT